MLAYKLGKNIVYVKEFVFFRMLLLVDAEFSFSFVLRTDEFETSFSMKIFVVPDDEQ